ncbi:hypothetical protein BCV70DRAFT_201908 [Testicularia cyperi]|uniref:Uncharacterized protein n=1 Tax=Testicularia cyperi TaxID=1882483 RepID=A0A317XKL4_9BASI|nr:hypothetical protein BCV70DRAFT_201908 [Testicularia cyperi]
MVQVTLPGSSEPYRLSADDENGDEHDYIYNQENRIIPSYPSRPKAVPSTSASTGISAGPSTTQRGATSSPLQEVSPAKSDLSQNAGAGKNKSLGSKIFSKLKPTHNKHNDQHESRSRPQSYPSSGVQTPDGVGTPAGRQRRLAAQDLDEALAREQRRRSYGVPVEPPDTSGLRMRNYKRARNSAIDSRDERDLMAASSSSAMPPGLMRQQSQASVHFPGDIFSSPSQRQRSLFPDESEMSSANGHGRAYERGQLSSSSSSGKVDRNDLREAATTSALGLTQSDTDEHFVDGSPHLGDDADLFDPYLREHDHELIYGRTQRRSFDSEDSDDTLTHLIREAEGYDSLRYSHGQLSGGTIDFDTLQAAHDSELVGSDNRSGFSAYSGGASKALSKPLLELEDIELESFLQSFARHTRQVTVPHAHHLRKRRMPEWSDFKVSARESPNGGASSRRPTMLARVDRGLQHLADGIQNSTSTVSKPLSKLTSRERQDDGEADESGLDDDYTSHGPDDSAADVKKGKSKSFKKSKYPSKNKKNSKKKNKLRDEDNEERGSEEWDLIVPSSSQNPYGSDIAVPDELHVNAQDEGVDGIAFCIAYILALVEKLAPEEIDHHPIRGYREGLIRSHLERLYTIAPFWEQLGFRMRRLYRWENPKTTAAAAMIYFVLWYTDMIPTAFILLLMYHILRFKYFPPSESYLHDKVKQRMERGKAANTLSEKLKRRSRLDILTIYKRWAASYGAPTQEAMGLVADFHEKIKNLILWRNPAATKRTLVMFGALNLFVTFAPAHYVYKTLFFFLGITFFCLLPLQSYFPSHRKALSPLWWATFGAPTDAQFAVQLLRKRHLDVDRFGKGATAEEVRRAVQGKPRADRREEGIAYDDLDDPSRASQDYVETSKDATLKPRKLGSFFCQYKGLPGRLHINTKYLYFTPLHSPAQKRGRTPVEAIQSLVKTKNIRLGIWNSLGLKIVRNNGKNPLLLANLQHRDDAFNLILAVSTNAR